MIYLSRSKNKTNSFLLGKIRRGFTLVEALVAMGVMAIVIAFVAYAGYRFFKKNAETAFQIKQWEMARSVQKRVNDLINSAVFIAAREHSSPPVFGIASVLVDNPGGALGERGDVLQIISIPPGTGRVVYSVIGSGNTATSLQLKDPKNIHPSQPYFNSGDWIYIAASTWTDLVQVVGATNASIGSRIQINPPLTNAVNVGDKILVIKVDVKTLHIRESDSSLILSSTFQSDPNLNLFPPPPNPDPIRREVLMNGAKRFFVNYEVARKPTQHRSDTCSLSDPSTQFYRYMDLTQSDSFSNGGLSNCNYNNLLKVKIDLEIENDKEDSSKFKTETWTAQPFRFLPANWGDFSSDNITGSTIVCDDRLERQRCLHECAGQYTAMNHHYDVWNNPNPSGLMKGSDFEEGTDYCMCKSEPEFSGNSWGSIAADPARYGRCCAYNETLRQRWLLQNPGNSSIQAQNCQFQWCTGVPRANNNLQSLCSPQWTCSKPQLSRTCLFPDLIASDNTRPMANICDPDNHTPDISAYLDNLNGSFGTPPTIGVPPPMTNGNGRFIDSNTGMALSSKFVAMHDSHTCNCFKQMYSFVAGGGGNTFRYRNFTLNTQPGITLPSQDPLNPAPRPTFQVGTPGNLVPFQFPDLLTGGAIGFSEAGNSAAHSIAIDSSGTIFQDGQPGRYEFQSYNNVQDRWGNGWLRCFDPLWDSPTIPAGLPNSGGPNFCQFDADSSNRVLRGPYDPGVYWWGGQFFPGSRPLNNGNPIPPDQWGDGNAREDNWMAMVCACARAGYPHDMAASLGANFNGFHPTAGLLSNVPCSCQDPTRDLPSRSEVNKAYFALPVNGGCGTSSSQTDADCRRARICLTCGCGGSGTSGSGTTGGTTEGSP